MGPARSSIVPGGSSRKLVLPLHHTATLFFPLIRLLAIHARRATSSVACAPRCLQPPSTWFLWLEPPLSPSSAPFILLLSPGCLGPSRSRTNEDEQGGKKREYWAGIPIPASVTLIHVRFFSILSYPPVWPCVCVDEAYSNVYSKGGYIYIYTGMLVVCHQHENGRRYDVGCMLNECGYDNELGYDRTTHLDFPASPARLICRVYRVWDQLPAQGHSRVTPCYRGRSNAILEWNSSILFPFVCCLSNDVGRCWDDGRR